MGRERERKASSAESGEWSVCVWHWASGLTSKEQWDTQLSGRTHQKLIPRLRTWETLQKKDRGSIDFGAPAPPVVSLVCLDYLSIINARSYHYLPFTDKLHDIWIV